MLKKKIKNKKEDAVVEIKDKGTESETKLTKYVFKPNIVPGIQGKGTGA